MAPLKRHDRRMLSVDYRWSQFKSGALRREIPVSIDQHHYAQLIVSPCHYCWGAPTQASRIGIDRMDSKKGYSLENCVPCCPVCNFMKNTMKYADFLSHVQLIAGHVYKPSGSTVYHAQQGPPPHQPRWRRGDLRSRRRRRHGHGSKRLHCCCLSRLRCSRRKCTSITT